MRTEYTTAGGQTTYGKTQIYQGLFYTADFNTASATVIINDLVYNLRTTEEWALEICQIARPVYYAANIIDLAMKQGLLVLGDITFSSSMVLDTSTPTPKWMVRCAFDVPDPAGGATQHYHYDVLPLSASMTTTGSETLVEIRAGIPIKLMKVEPPKKLNAMVVTWAITMKRMLDAGYPLSLSPGPDELSFQRVTIDNIDFGLVGGNQPSFMLETGITTNVLFSPLGLNHPLIPFSIANIKSGFKWSNLEVIFKRIDDALRLDEVEVLSDTGEKVHPFGNSKTYSFIKGKRDVTMIVQQDIALDDWDETIDVVVKIVEATGILDSHPWSFIQKDIKLERALNREALAKAMVRAHALASDPSSIELLYPDAWEKHIPTDCGQRCNVFPNPIGGSQAFRSIGHQCEFYILNAVGDPTKVFARPVWLVPYAITKVDPSKLHEKVVLQSIIIDVPGGTPTTRVVNLWALVDVASTSDIAKWSQSLMGPVAAALVDGRISTPRDDDATPSPILGTGITGVNEVCQDNVLRSKLGVVAPRACSKAVDSTRCNLLFGLNEITGEFEVLNTRTNLKGWWWIGACPKALASCKVPVVDDTKAFDLLVHRGIIDGNTKWKELSYAEWIRWHFDNPDAHGPLTDPSRKTENDLKPYKNDLYNFACFWYGVWPRGSRFSVNLDDYYAA